MRPKCRTSCAVVEGHARGESDGDWCESGKPFPRPANPGLQAEHGTAKTTPEDVSTALYWNCEENSRRRIACKHRDVSERSGCGDYLDEISQQSGLCGPDRRVVVIVVPNQRKELFCSAVRLRPKKKKEKKKKSWWPVRKGDRDETHFFEPVVRSSTVLPTIRTSVDFKSRGRSAVAFCASQSPTLPARFVVLPGIADPRGEQPFRD